MHRSKSMAMVFLLGVFLAGGAAGFAANEIAGPEKPCKSDGASYRERFAAELGLSDSQRRVVDSLMEAKRTRVRALYGPMRPRLDSIGRVRDSIFEDTQRNLKALLSPKQQARFDQMHREWRTKKH